MAGQIDITIDEQGAGAPIWVLHGGGGPLTVAGLAAHLAGYGRVFTPTHPGWNGTVLPESIANVDDLAALYLGELARRGLTGVTIVGSSMGGWLAAAMAVQDQGRRIGRLVLIDAVGVEVAGESIADFFGLTLRQIAEHAYHDPDRFFVDPATLPPQQIATQRGNMASLRTLAGAGMADPALLGRLRAVTVPVLVVWGESDRIATASYGRALAGAFGDGRFALIERAGHLPQLERPEATLAAIDAFLASGEASQP